jgi:hypothetical protein
MNILNPIEIVESLDVEAIRTQLELLDKQEVALRKLLRVALARQRGTVGRPGRRTPEASKQVSTGAIHV